MIALTEEQLQVILTGKFGDGCLATNHLSKLHPENEYPYYYMTSSICLEYIQFKTEEQHRNDMNRLKRLVLTWKDCKRIVEIADALAEYAEAGIIEPFLASEEAFYKEVLKRFRGE